MADYKEFALQEFKALGYKPIEKCKDDPDKWIQENVLELLEIFDKQGHSGSSAPYCINMFSKLAKFECIAPLTGEDWEWNLISDDLYQNRRCFRVFKENGVAYDSEAIIFRETGDSSSFMSKKSRVPVTFPYIPKMVCIEINKANNKVKIDNEWFEINEGLKKIKEKEFNCNSLSQMP